MYSNSDEEGVTLQLRDVDENDSKNNLASVLAQLQEEDAAALSISYQDGEVLTDVLLDSTPSSSIGLNNETPTFDLFDSESVQDLTLSPQTFTSSTEAFINDNSDSLGVSSLEHETVDSTEDYATVDPNKLIVTKPRSKASSPSRQGPQQCLVCGKIFGNASALAKHRLTHSDERKYVCNMCTKAFKRQDHLNGHMLTHRSKKPYECKAEGCGKSYCDARSLRRHTENHHASSNANTPTSPDGSSSLSSCIQFAGPPPPPATPPSVVSSTINVQSPTISIPSPTLSAQSPTISIPSPTISIPSPVTIVKGQNHLQQLLASDPISSNVSKIAAILEKGIKQPVSSVESGVTYSTKKTSPTDNTASTLTPKIDPKPVECNLCHRKFKNFPALNGHMRLHGGYFKKDAESKRAEKRESNAPPLQTASISVRALIEEKIIQKRITNPGLSAQTQTNLSTYSAESVKIVSALQSNAAKASQSEDKVPPSTIASAVPSEQDSNQSNQKTIRRHSDSESLIPHPVLQKDLELLKNPDLESKDGSKNIKMETSEPNVIRIRNDLLSNLINSKSIPSNDQRSELPKETLNASNINSIPQSDSIEKNIADSSSELPNSSNSNQNKELQSILKTILPVSLSDLIFQSNSPKVADSNITTQSPTSTTFSTMEMSQNNAPTRAAVIHQPVDSFCTSPLTKQELGEAPQVAPSSSIRAILSMPAPQLPSVTTSTSLVTTSSVFTPTSTETLQSQLMSSSEDPMLSSCPKDFSSRKRFDFQTLKLLSNGKMDILSSNSQNLAEVLLNCNCEVKFIQMGSSIKTVKDLCKTTAVLVKTENTTSFKIKTEDIKQSINQEIKLDLIVGPNSGTANTSTTNRKRRLSENSPAHQPQSKSSMKDIGSLSSNFKSPFTYTPHPILSTTFSGSVPSWRISSTWPHPESIKRDSVNGDNEMTSCNITPHINIGLQFQAEVPRIEATSNRCTTDTQYEYLLWDPCINDVASNKEVDMYLEFACCASMQGGGRNKECALHLLNLCHGNIHEAMIKLMQPIPMLLACHPLLSFKYSDEERWSFYEIDQFLKAIARHEKKFSLIAKEIGSKNYKQCIQFYYLWKKACPQEYSRLKLIRHKRHEVENSSESVKVDSVTKLDLFSPISENLHLLHHQQIAGQDQRILSS